MKNRRKNSKDRQITMDEKIRCQEAGYIAVVRFLQTIKQLRVYETIGFNNQRYHMSKTQNGNIMIVFKRDFFNSFGTIFASEGESGVGETLNCDDLKLALQNDIKEIYFIYSNAHIYKISLENFLNNSHKRINDSEGKDTRSINIKHLERIGEMYV